MNIAEIDTTGRHFECSHKATGLCYVALKAQNALISRCCIVQSPFICFYNVNFLVGVFI